MNQEFKDQLACKCIHFTGIQNKKCKAGVNYDSVRSESKPYKWPCLNNKFMECFYRQFPTEEQIQDKLDEIAVLSNKSIDLYLKAKEQYESDHKATGIVPCECGGNFHYKVVGEKRHFHGKCDNCGTSFME